MKSYSLYAVAIALLLNLFMVMSLKTDVMASRDAHITILPEGPAKSIILYSGHSRVTSFMVTQEVVMTPHSVSFTWEGTWTEWTGNYLVSIR